MISSQAKIKTLEYISELNTRSRRKSDSQYFLDRRELYTTMLSKTSLKSRRVFNFFKIIERGFPSEHQVTRQTLKSRYLILITDKKHAGKILKYSKQTKTFNVMLLGVGVRVRREGGGEGRAWTD